jgi:alpha-1,6-mannosyltransferase
MLRQPAVGASTSRWSWPGVGLILIAIHAVLLALSPRFAYGVLPVIARPAGWVVGLMMGAGAAYLAAIWWLRLPARPGRGWWAWMILVGAAMRALMLPSTPILETDYFRYLWDGAVTAHGQNPYAYSPQAILEGRAPAELVELGDASGPVLGRVNQPHLTTIYPPTAQAAFALSYGLMPWRIEGLRLTFLLFDVATFVLLIGLLRQLARPTSWSLIYWWNPLLIKEGFNTAHMEMTLLPLIVAAVWLAVRRRHVAGAIVLALAVGAKLWPVLLLPALLRQQGQARRRIGRSALVFSIAAIVIVSPMLLTRLDQEAGVVAYAATWQVNASLYQGILWAAGRIAPDHAQAAARIAVGVLLLGWIGWLCRKPAADGRAVCERAMWIVAGLFLLSPTQYPWYWLWLLPLLAVRPSPGLLLLTATLPMYYLRFPMRELGWSAWFNHGVVWLQFVPAYALLAVEAWRRVRSTETPGERLGAVCRQSR